MSQAMSGFWAALEGLSANDCPCGQPHPLPGLRLHIGAGVRAALAETVEALGIARPLVFTDQTLDALARAEVLPLLPQAGYHVLPWAEPEAGAEAIGELQRALSTDAGGRVPDGLVAVGSGSLNDIGKALAAQLDIPLILVATAPSMDGFASATSSLLVDGVKVSVPTRMPSAVLADFDLIRSAPLRMFYAGLGDMIAKYTSLADWRIAALVVDEPYCPAIAQLIRDALARCMTILPSLPTRSDDVCSALLEGLVLSGLAMALAGSSRPASGTEHYISHIWDMRGASLGLQTDLHGLQCLVGTLETMGIMAQLKTLSPDAAHATRAVASFDEAAGIRAG